MSPFAKLTAPVASAVFAVAAVALAAGPAAAAQDPLAQAVAQGAELFSHGTFGGNSGRVCETCHVGGGKVPGLLPGGRKIPSLVNAKAIFPRFSPSAGRVISLEGQLRRCIQGGVGGKAPAAGDASLVALEAYLGSIAHGQPVDIGGKPK